jgi:hypothetical protein
VASRGVTKILVSVKHFTDRVHHTSENKRTCAQQPVGGLRRQINVVRNRNKSDSHIDGATIRIYERISPIVERSPEQSNAHGSADIISVVKSGANIDWVQKTHLENILIYSVRKPQHTIIG